MLNLPVTDDEQNNFKLVTITTRTFMYLKKLEKKTSLQFFNFLDLVVVT